jgi:arabinogalactan oligomer/maltooligosaccharide transport system permease protein
MHDQPQGRLALTYMMPALVLLTVLSLLPNAYSVYLAFTNHSLFHFQEYSFVGLRNFQRILFGPEMETFGRVFAWTLAWAGLSTTLSLVIGLALALPLNTEGLRGVNFYRTLFIVPWAIPAFISVLMWKGLLNSSDQGAINAVLVQWGHAPVPWLDDPIYSKISVLLVNTWLGYPFMLTVCLGALQSIPRDLFEASGMDGASPPRQFLSVTVPMLKPALIPVIVSSFAFNFNQFATIYLLTAGGPPVPGSDAGSTDILITTAYKLAFTQYQYGLASAYAVLIFLVVASLSWFNFQASGAFEE